MKKLPPNVSRYQYESLLLLAYSPRFREEARKLHTKHASIIGNIKDFHSGADEKRFAVDLKKTMKKYNLPDNFIVPVGNFIKTLRPEQLINNPPPFFDVEEIESHSGGPKHIAVEFYIKPTVDEMEIVRKAVAGAFENEGFISRGNATSSLIRNLNIYMLRSGILNRKKKVDEIVSILYEDVADESNKELADLDKTRKFTVEKAEQEVKKEFKKRFNQEIE